jgi:hypothetical protein
MKLARSADIGHLARETIGTIERTLSACSDGEAYRDDFFQRRLFPSIGVSILVRHKLEKAGPPMAYGAADFAFGSPGGSVAVPADERTA